MLHSSCFSIYVYFRLICQPTIIEMPSIIRNEKITCENWGTQTTRKTFVRQKKRCSHGILYCTHCPNLSTKSQNDLNYHMHGAPKTDVTFKCKLCFIKSIQDFMLYVNIETLNKECRLDQEQEMWM